MNVGDGCDALGEYERKIRAGRRDGRASGELRALRVEQDVLERCDGSARLTCGGTEVLVAVYGPVECPLKLQQADRAVVTVNVRAGGVASSAGGPLHWFERFVQGAVKPSIFVERHPRTSINIVIHILEEDGSVLAAAVNAATLAAVDAGLSMRSMVCAASVSLNSAGILVLDSTLTEQSEALVHATFAFDSSKQGIVAAKVWGFFESEESYFAAQKACQLAAAKVCAFLRVALEKKIISSIAL